LSGKCLTGSSMCHGDLILQVPSQGREEQTKSILNPM
jgi:hypothetical protein